MYCPGTWIFFMDGYYWQAPCPYILLFLSVYSLVVGSYFGMPPLLLPGLEPASPGTPTVLTRIHCSSLKPDMNKQPSRLQNKRQGAVMRIRFEQSFEAWWPSKLSWTPTTCQKLTLQTAPLVLSTVPPVLSTAPPVLSWTWILIDILELFETINNVRFLLRKTGVDA